MQSGQTWNFKIFTLGQSPTWICPVVVQLLEGAFQGTYKNNSDNFTA